MTANNTDETNHEEKAERPSVGLVRTARPGLATTVDPDIEIALEESGLTPEDIMAVIEAREQRKRERPEKGVEGVEDKTPKEERPCDADTRVQEGEEGGPYVPGGAEANEEAGEALADGDGTPIPSVTLSDEFETSERTTGTHTALSKPTESPAGNKTSVEQEAPHELAARTLVVMLAKRAAQSSQKDNREVVEAVITEAVDEYLVALLAGQASGDEDELFTLSLDTSPLGEQVLDGLVAEDERFASTADLVRQGIASICAVGSEGTHVGWEIGTHRQWLDAVVKNEAYAFDAREAVVESAVAWYCCSL
jgi:hypothetical protein